MGRSMVASVVASSILRHVRSMVASHRWGRTPMDPASSTRTRIRSDQTYQSATDIYGLVGDSSSSQQVFNNCGGQSNTQWFLDKLKQSGEDLLRCRAQIGTASTVVVIQHYPGSGKTVKAAFDENVPANRSVGSISAYGHAHQQHCDGRNGEGQCDMILTGGGGGCCSGDIVAGFTAVHLTDDGGFTSDVESDAVRVYGCAWSYEEVEVASV